MAELHCRWPEQLWSGQGAAVLTGGRDRKAPKQVISLKSVNNPTVRESVRL